MKRRHYRPRELISILIFSLLCVLLFIVISFQEAFTGEPKANSFSIKIITSSNKEQTINIDPSKSGLLLNFHESYSCPYYSDRADLICPEINRVAQFLRSLGFKIIFNTTTEDSTKIHGNYQIKESNSLYLDETSPLFDGDKCLYQDFDVNPAKVNPQIHHDILYSTKSDYFIHDTVNAVALAKQLGLKYLIVSGMKCNLWLPPLFDMLESEKIQPIYLYDLSDVAYHRKAQVEKLDTHVKALTHFWEWVANKYGMIVNHFDILDRPLLNNQKGNEIKFDGNIEAYLFYDYYRKDKISSYLM